MMSVPDGDGVSRPQSVNVVMPGSPAGYPMPNAQVAQNAIDPEPQPLPNQILGYLNSIAQRTLMWYPENGHDSTAGHRQRIKLGGFDWSNHT